MPTNPVLTRFETETRSGSAGRGASGTNVYGQPAPSAEDLQRMYGQPSYGGPPAPPTTGGRGWGGGGGGGGSAPTRYMTLDSVVLRTGAMLGMILLFGAIAWTATSTGIAGPLLAVGLIGGLGLGLFIAFTGRANAVTCLIYAACEGLLLGAISRVVAESSGRGGSIVIQAVTGTVMVAAGMLFVYKIGAIRVTPRFTRIVFGATVGILGLVVVNLIASIWTHDGLGLRDGGPLAIGFSLLCIVVASMNLVVDFDVVERGIRSGADEKFAWYASFGLTVTLVWLYIEILRLLSYLTGRNS